VATDIVFTVSSWNNFIKDPVIKNGIWYPGSGQGNTINIGPQIKGRVYKGKWGGYDLWLYNDWYVDDVTNVEQPMLADGMVIMSGPEMQGTRRSASIVDPMHNYRRCPTRRRPGCSRIRRSAS
jgi:hypothetical protein